MKSGIKTCLSLAIGMALALAAVSSPALAQQAAPTQYAVGMVDLDRIVREHPVMIKWQKEFEKVKAEREAQVEKTVKEKFGITDQSQFSQEQRDQVQRMIAQENQRFQSEMGPKQLEKMKQVEEDIKAQSAVIATEKKLFLVLDRSVVIYGGVDITETLLDRIKAKYQ